MSSRWRWSPGSGRMAGLLGAAGPSANARPSCPGGPSPPLFRIPPGRSTDGRRTLRPAQGSTGRRYLAAVVGSPPVHELLLVGGEAGLQVVRRGGRVVLGAGVQPQPPRVVTEGPVDHPLQEILPQ